MRFSSCFAQIRSQTPSITLHRYLRHHLTNLFLDVFRFFRASFVFVMSSSRRTLTALCERHSCFPPSGNLLDLMYPFLTLRWLMEQRTDANSIAHTTHTQKPYLLLSLNSLYSCVWGRPDHASGRASKFRYPFDFN